MKALCAIGGAVSVWNSDNGWVAVMNDSARLIRFLYRGYNLVYLKLHIRPFRRILSSIFAVYRGLNRGKIVVTKIDGIVYELDLDEAIDSFIYYSGCYEPKVTAFINRYVKAGMTVIDAGANVGCHTTRLARLVGQTGQVIAFEPMPWAFSKLKRNIELNSFNHVLLERMGLSDSTRNDLVCFRSSWTLDSDSSPDSEGDTPVQFTTLNEYVSTSQINRLDLIKVDVDGYEYRVIRGGQNVIREFKPVLIVEMGRSSLGRYGDDVTGLVDLLASFGYEFYSEDDLNRYADRESLLEAIPDKGIINVICRAEESG